MNARYSVSIRTNAGVSVAENALYDSVIPVVGDILFVNGRSYVVVQRSFSLWNVKGPIESINLIVAER